MASQGGLSPAGCALPIRIRLEVTASTDLLGGFSLTSLIVFRHPTASHDSGGGKAGYSRMALGLASLVPTLCVGTHLPTLRVERTAADGSNVLRSDAERRVKCRVKTRADWPLPRRSERSCF